MIYASPRFNKRNQFAAFSASLIAVLLIALVPFGRDIQLKVEPWFDPGFELLLVLVGFLLLAIYYLRAARREPTLIASHILGVTNLLLLCVLTADRTVEYLHPILYGTLSASALVATGNPTATAARLQCYIFATVFSISDEILQGLDPGRVFDLRDLLLNNWGIILGILFTSPSILDSPDE